MKHPNQRLILEFLGGRASELEAEALFAHLDVCGPCAQRLETLRALSADFDGAWDSFREELDLRAEARQEAAASPDQWELLVEGVMDGARRLSTLAATGLSGALRSIWPQPVLVPAYAGAGSPGWAGVADLAATASEHCRAGRAADALAVLDEIRRRFPEAAATGMMELRAGSRIVGKVVVDAHRRVVAVMIDRAWMASFEGWAELEIAGETRRALLEPVEGARCRLAEFEQIPDASFGVRLKFTLRAASQIDERDPHRGGDAP